MGELLDRGTVKVLIDNFYINDDDSQIAILKENLSIFRDESTNFVWNRHKQRNLNLIEEEQLSKNNTLKLGNTLKQLKGMNFIHMY